VDKQEVIAEIHRLTEANGGVPPGQKRFRSETGIRDHEVIGRLWPNWGEALKAAGFAPNTWTGPMDEDALFDQYVALARRIGKLPTRGDLGVEATANPGFPARTTFARRLGTKSQIAQRVRAWCEENPGNDDVLAMCPPASALAAVTEDGDEPATVDTPPFGFVYLLKSGRRYKVGRSNDAGRRGYEVRLQLPDPVEEVHKIKTDDPEGIEAYWHRRFADRRLNGEWFDLRKAEVDAFKRWRRIS
jgi:hypothetical protein